MTFELKFWGSFGQEEIFDFPVFFFMFIGPYAEVLLQILDLFFQVIYFLLEGEDAFPFDFEFITLGVDFSERDSDLFREDFCAFGVLVFDEVFENVFIELVFLVAGQHHLQFNIIVIKSNS